MKRSSKGFSIVEVLVALGMVGILSTALVCLSEQSFKQQNQNNITFQADNIRRDIRMRINSSVTGPGGQTAWQNTITSNSSMSCLANNTDCSAYINNPQVFNLIMDSSNPANTVYNLTPPSQGFRSDGSPCSAFSATAGAGNDSCPLTFTLKWSPICGGPGNCTPPNVQALISVTANYNPLSAVKNISFNANNYSETFIQGIDTPDCWSMDSAGNIISTKCNVGIGTTAPTGLLDVEGGTTSSGNGNSITLNAQSASGTGGAGGAININPGYPAVPVGQCGWTGSCGGLEIGNYHSNNNVPVVIHGTLFVGTNMGFSTFGTNIIGSNNSANVTGGGSVAIMNIFGSSNQINENAGPNTVSEEGFILAGNNNTFNPGSGNAVVLGNSNTITGASQLVVGLNNTSTSSSAGNIVFGEGNTINHSGATNITIGQNLTNNIDGAMMIGPSDSNKMTMINNNVGIGTTNPNYALDVKGDANVSAGNALRIAGTSVCTSAGCTSSSDRRLKENIKPLQNSLDHILKLQGVDYDYKDKNKFSDKHQVGVIAQDVEKIYPEVVQTDAKTGFKSVAYDHLIAPLIEAVKTIYNRVTGLEAKLQKLETESAAKDQKIKELEQRLEKIEKALKPK